MTGQDLTPEISTPESSERRKPFVQPRVEPLGDLKGLTQQFGGTGVG